MTAEQSTGAEPDRDERAVETNGFPMRRRDVLASGAGVVALTGLAGCAGGDGNGGNGEDGSTTDIAIISSPAGFGGGAFNDLALEGLENAQDDYDIEIQQVEETDQSNYPTVQSQLAEESNPDYDVIVMVGYQHVEALETNAVDYPDQNWMLINDNIEEPNVANYTWANHEMSYQAGVFAATLTSESISYDGSETDSGGNHVGFVGGVDESLINAFQEAYEAGVAWVDEDIEVSVGYAGSYESPSDGREVALSQYEAGADIIYHAAAATGEGVFQAAQDQSRFAVGVDSDQSRTLSDYSGVILGSAVKWINAGTNEVAEAVVEDDFESVAGAHVLGLEEDGVELVTGQDFEGALPDVVQENLDEARQAIVDGDIEVPCNATGC